MSRKLVPDDIVHATQVVLNAAFQIHTEIGPGCFERVYETVLCRVLHDEGLSVVRQAPVPFEFRGELVPMAFRVDLLVEDAILVELKSVSKLAPVHYSQLRTYIRISGLPVGLLINFGEDRLRDGYERMVHPDYAFLPPARTSQDPTPGASGTSGVSGSSGASGVREPDKPQAPESHANPHARGPVPHVEREAR